MKSVKVTTRSSMSGPLSGVAAGVLLLALILLSAPVNAPAVELHGTSSTYLQSRETANGDKPLPLYEYLSFSAQDLGKESISFHFGGWLRFDLGDDTPAKDKNSDLQYAFLSYRHGTSNAVAHAGRIMVFEGVAAERVDGVYARSDLDKGFGISAYGGAPVMTSEGDDSGDNSVYGARVSHRMGDLYTIGVSYLKQEKNSRDFREEQGVDLSLRPFSKVELAGISARNSLSKEWMRSSYNLLLGPFAKLKFNTELSWINYGSYFAGSTNNAFSFQPGGLVDPKEQLTLLGETVSYAINDNMSAAVDYEHYGYDIAGTANRAGICVAYSIPQSYRAGVSLHRMDGESDRLSYNQYRAYAAKKMGKMDAALDLLHVKYDEAINSVTNAYAASLALGYELTQALKLGFDAEYAKNPDFDKNVSVFAKVIYNFAVAGGGRKEGGR